MVADLYQTTFGKKERPASEELKAHMAEVFFENPWYDDTLPSLVYEENNGQVVGFLGIVPRWMMLRGKRLKMAVGSQFMVNPDSRNTLAAMQLLKTFFSGAQDLAMTDGANGAAHQIWEAFGGSSVPIYSLCWTRTLCEGDQSYIASQSRALIAEEETNAHKMCSYLSKLTAGMSLRPEYDAASFTWLLHLAAQKKKFGPLRNEVLRNPQGDLVGWYLYYLNVGGMTQVLQLAALPTTIAGVLQHLFYRAREQGSTAASGRMEPRFLHELYHHHCQFTCASAMLIQSEDRDILRAIYTGDAFLTRLEGEWWNRFNELVQ